MKQKKWNNNKTKKLRRIPAIFPTVTKLNTFFSQEFVLEHCPEATTLQLLEESAKRYRDPQGDTSCWQYEFRRHCEDVSKAMSTRHANAAKLIRVEYDGVIYDSAKEDASNPVPFELKGMFYSYMIFSLRANRDA
jgi:hypothetical protein